MPDGDEVSISASLQGDLAAGLEDVQHEVDDTGDAADRMGAKGQAGGRAYAAGMDKAARGADRARNASREFAAAGGRANEQLRDTARDSRLAASGLDRFAKKAQKAAKSAGGLGVALTAVKWGAIVSGVFALVGGLSALGAGAAIAVGGLSPMVGVVAGALPLFAAAKLSMLAWKLAATQLEPVLTRIKNQFTELGNQIAKGGLRSGLNYFANSLGGLADVAGRGLASLGGQIGQAARKTGDLVASAPFLAQITRIFHGLEPIVGNVTDGLLYLARAIINVIEGAMPMAQTIAADFAAITQSLAEWTAAQLANGQMAAWLNKSYSIFKRTIGVIVDVLVGLFNIFRAGAGYAGDMGASIEDAAARFREWTGSAEGQARINTYFQDSLPALREMGRLLGMAAAGFGSMAANANVAPLLAQIRTELAPAVSDLANNLAGQGGLGPATITAATAMVRLMASLDFSALTMFLQALGGVVNGIVWVSHNVPGASFVISGLLGAFMGFKLLGPVFSMVAGGAKAFAWIKGAATLTGELSVMQKYLGGIVFPMLRTFAGFLGGALVTAVKAVGLALKAAFITSPIGWIILAIAGLVAGFIYLWNKSAAFRDFFIGIWEAMKAAFSAVVNAIVTAWTSTVSALTTAWQAAVNFIVMVAMWIWDHGLKQVVTVIVAAFQVAWNIIVFIVQTAVYIIMAVVALIAVIMEAIWKLIAAGAMWLWNTVLLPVFTAIGVAWSAVTTALGAAWTAVVTALSTAWNWFWTTILQPVFSAISVAWTAVTGAIGTAWNAVVGALTAVWNGFKSVVTTVINAVKTAWNALVSWMAPIFAPVGRAISAVFNGIKSVAEAVGRVIKGIWDGIIGAIKWVWNLIAKVWNSIPSVTIPDWVPIVGGSTFGLPKMPILFAGGEAPGGRAVVGEAGPEPLVRGGNVIGMVGQHGPEVAKIPPGGYVVPSLDTLRRIPGLTRTLPADVAAAVSRSVPGYGSVLAHEDTRPAAPPLAAANTRSLESALADLAAELRRRPPTVNTSGGDVAAEVERVMRKLRREDELNARYRY